MGAEAAISVHSADAGSAAGVYALAAGPMRATVRPLEGGRIASLWREEPKGRRTDVLHPLPERFAFDPHRWPKGGCYPLAPWSNSIRNARFAFEGENVQLPPHPDRAPHVMHGFCHQRPWTVTQHGESTLVMRYRHQPDAWPWAFEATQRLSLDTGGLTIEISVANLSDRAMPVGLGVHPFFAVTHGDLIRFTASTRWRADETGCAVAAEPLDAVQGRYAAAHGGAAITAYFAGYEGMASIARQDGTRIVMESGGPLDHLIFHVPEGGPYACIEPVSHVADAFNLQPQGIEGSGARRLAAKDSLAAVVRIGLA